jgi:hypothetical protein
MNEDLALLREYLNKLPFWVLLPFIVAISVLSVLLYIALSPLAFLYRLLLRPMVWMEWEKRGIDALVIDMDSAHATEWMSRLRPLVSGRATFLNWSHRQEWDNSSLPTKLFQEFRPRVKTESMTVRYLPAVIVFRKLHSPRLFTFGARSKDPEEKLEQLRATLA